MANMYYMRGLANGNVREACQFVENRFPAAGFWKGVCSAGFINVSVTMEHLF
jgi:hypothetical protein